MRLEILDQGHRLRTKALLALIRLVSRQPVVDAVKLAFYRPDFYGAGDPPTRHARTVGVVDRRSRADGGVRLGGQRRAVLHRRALGHVEPVVRRCDEGHRHPCRCGYGADRGAAPGDASHARQAHS